ncbi:hypothetical protein [Aquimarina brevivitae]|uniref:Uncharacterized protein n=1 Tax=Aquimarina brevivitae TaxID=323412 RepID=A0A4Q7P1C2_9FLAO|nr:hypothetical protein [Aquimarina brevivitae]RZS93633.1 hypothetical protein EV197_2213 [Aquimarina brevivitae]
MKFWIYFSLLVCFISCGVKPKQAKPAYNNELSQEQLLAKGIVPISAKYKNSYFRVFPYLFYNKGNAFNSIAGDFFNVKYKTSNFNIMVGFYKKYEGYENVQVVLVSMSENSKIPLKDQVLSATSSKHGDFSLVKLDQKNYYIRTLQQVLLINPLVINNDADILDKLYDDVITVTISDQEYTFLNPELKLE